MSRDEGFAVMDVSTSICDDPKFRLLQRETPDDVAVGFTVYVSALADSWKAGHRVTADSAWPSFLPFDQGIIDSLIRVGLLDRGGRVSPKAWREYFEAAHERRATARDRWAKYNRENRAVTASLPRGNRAATASSAPSVPPVRSSRSSRLSKDVERIDERPNGAHLHALGEHR